MSLGLDTSSEMQLTNDKLKNLFGISCEALTVKDFIWPVLWG